jgi:hypothetical protein
MLEDLITGQINTDMFVELATNVPGNRECASARYGYKKDEPHLEHHDHRKLVTMVN